MKIWILVAVQTVWLALTAGADVSKTNGTVTFAVTTVPTTGKYAPHHVIAIWITDSENSPVKTLAVYAAKRKKYLAEWLTSSRSNDVDAVTGATLKSHQVHTVTWDCRDAKGNAARYGKYKLHVEFTEINGKGPSTPQDHIEFTIGPQAATVTPADLPNFRNMSVKYAPAGPPQASGK